MFIGEISQIYRYPVKSFAGESLDSILIEKYGLYGDRSHAIIDHSKEGWRRFITARQIPGMLNYKAHFGPPTSHTQFPELTLTAPDGRQLSWNDELIEEFQQHYEAPISLERHTPQSDLLAVDDSSILIITESSMRELAEKWDKPVDPRRFRANFVITLKQDIPFAETDWVNRQFAAGSAVFQVNKPCERCTVITIDPDQLSKDNSLLMLLHEEHDKQFGMYASVIKTGTISMGDQVRLI
jgi:uncharacterized protein YcbX